MDNGDTISNFDGRNIFMLEPGHYQNLYDSPTDFEGCGV